MLTVNRFHKKSRVTYFRNKNNKNITAYYHHLKRRLFKNLIKLHKATLKNILNKKENKEIFNYKSVHNTYGTCLIKLMEFIARKLYNKTLNKTLKYRLLR